MSPLFWDRLGLAAVILAVFLGMGACGHMWGQP